MAEASMCKDLCPYFLASPITGEMFQNRQRYTAGTMESEGIYIYIIYIFYFFFIYIFRHLLICTFDI